MGVSAISVAAVLTSRVFEPVMRMASSLKATSDRPGAVSPRHAPTTAFIKPG
jgi:hypothetical protein